MSNYFADIGLWPRAAKSMGRAYAWGYVLSLLLTVASFALALLGLLQAHVIVPALLLLAAAQFAVQVMNFLHVSGAPDSRERLIVLSCAIMVVVIIVVGSIWIMANLDARMMPGQTQTTEQMEQYMQREQGI